MMAPDTSVITANVGTATNMPTMPPIVKPTSSAIRMTAGCMSSDRPKTDGREEAVLGDVHDDDQPEQDDARSSDHRMRSPTAR